ncbi:hypothetical protein P171DRAFT_99177 [Karstenula rhodostoma CBS 690.94]|uniref:Secreted protein n=1 Tax=Karstenula rhodostoma CBS 690.94 TaxID=1392251 RepID=A0A9P4P8E6_9PLEO|nr:hypothetical protein P171DRAFT_99177 [Karstenula rhodostoma CBS 690.94]
MHKTSCRTRAMSVGWLLFVRGTGNCHWIILDEFRSCFQQPAMPWTCTCPAHWRQEGIPTTRPWNKSIPGIDRFEMEMIGF